MEKKTNQQQLGTLWIAATTLGDMIDIPLRSLELMRVCQFLVFEEDKRARQFLKAAGVQRQWMRYTEQREEFTREELERELKLGHDALYMSDQGTPGLADPGRDLVEVALRIGAKVRPVPGPSSLTATISVCPIDCRRFTFAGFAPREESDREAFLRTHARGEYPFVLFDTPYRIKAFFDSLENVLKGTGRKVFVAIDISEATEDYWLGSIEAINKKIKALTEKHNFVVIVEGTGIPSAGQKTSKPNAPRPNNGKRPFKKAVRR
jgi:16S rRNA (cytidine1402-2'-O)-methyltransferase